MPTILTHILTSIRAAVMRPLHNRTPNSNTSSPSSTDTLTYADFDVDLAFGSIGEDSCSGDLGDVVDVDFQLFVAEILFAHPSSASPLSPFGPSFCTVEGGATCRAVV